ncbi:hypothetical protein SAMN05216302_10464 [Nitrosomonas aestuarii]|uniref:Uncharacterized protein n=1 Tax=Nitrosomonas aestuarii TaxID=52441 RepID=A0A1I4G0W5_9PROT|nr:hypothetical protein [Nitrosomonas aestuarii]SFL23735.1 hypothetical protein SAMN05216302_10464 [Nitrosomonas aestuarii]
MAAQHSNRTSSIKRYTSEDDEPIPGYCVRASDQAAEKAVKKTFAMLGVDVNDPASVEEFREDLRFGKKMRRYADYGALALIGVMATALAGAIWAGIMQKINGA